ncbi:MAG TPA: 50S ribosomal protein L11 methyltransferase, partial [bacterium]|nr:50S ribosomal protein L11 methyltransferase [bacterium]
MGETEIDSQTSAPLPPSDLSALSIPDTLGKIQEVYPSNSPYVILIQDAHAIPEAQRNIQKLIDYFRTHYEINRIALEGASSELDALIFNSFPDKGILKQTFEEYMDKGELTGGTAAAIFSAEGGSDFGGNGKALFRGIEDWELYEEGMGLYLKAMEQEEELMGKLEALRVGLREEKERIYSKELLKVDGALDRLHNPEADLVTVLKELERTREQVKSKLNQTVPLSLQALLDEIKQEGDDLSSIEQELRGLAEKLRKMSDTFSVSDTAEFNQIYQAFQTSKISAAEFGLWMKEFVEKKTDNHALLAPFSVKLLQQMQRHKRLWDLEGTQFFKEFEIYVQSVKESLFRNDAERELDRESRRLYLMEKLAKLELSREEWEEIRKAPFVKREADFENHRAFYENGEDREKVFLSNLNRLLKQNASRDKLNASIFIAGGFHTEGLAKQLKQKGISYVVIRPEIGQIPEKSFYRAHMRGDVSWKDYFRVEDGKVNLYDAFVRGARDKLLGEALSVKREAQDNAGLMKYASRDTLHSSRLLKAWRDQIIRDLAQKEQLAKAHKYTQFLDEMADRGRAQNKNNVSVPYLNAKSASLSTLRDSLARIDRFIQGIRYLERMEQLNKKSLLELLNPSTIPPLTVSAAIDSAVRVDDPYLIRTLVRSETRHIKQEKNSEGSEAGNLIDAFEKELPVALVNQHLTSIYSLNDQGSRLLDTHGKEIIYHFASARPEKQKVGAVSYIRIGNWMFFDHRLKPDLEILLQRKYQGLRPRIIYLHEMKSSLTDYKDAVAEWTGPMIAALDSIDLRGKTILDLGAGDGLLSLLAVKKGAAYAILVDYDPASYDLFTNHLAANEMNAGDFGFVGGDLRDKDRILKKIGNQPVNVIFGNIGEHPLIYPRGTHLDAISYLNQLPHAEYYLAGGYAPGQPLGNQDKYFKQALNALKQKGFQEVARYRQVYNFAQNKFGPKTALVMRRNLQRSEVRSDFENEQLVPIMTGVKELLDEYREQIKKIERGR